MTIEDIANEVYDKLTDTYGYYLGGYCSIGSVMLFKMLQKAGFSPTIHASVDNKKDYNCFHVFVVVNEKVVDVTCSQFDEPNYNLPNILIEDNKKSKRRKHWYWKTYKTFTNTLELIEWQIEDGHCMEIIPTM